LLEPSVGTRRSAIGLRQIGGISSDRATKRLVGIATVVAIAVLVRELPATLIREEPLQFWARVPTMDPPRYLLEPWAGYLQVWARAAFLVAYPFGDAGPLVTRIIAALAVGAVAAFLASNRMRSAIPDGQLRLGIALSLALVPTAAPNAYDGPLNSQWWFAILAICIALVPPRRWDGPLLLGLGLTGAAPCLVLPVFRDRRALWLLVPTVMQAALVATSTRRPLGLGISPEYTTIAFLLIVVMIVARLPGRTRLAFVYVGLAIIALGALTYAGVPGNWRYLADAWVGIFLGVGSRAVALFRPSASRASPAG
jgi:hypothetical protein